MDANDSKASDAADKGAALRANADLARVRRLKTRVARGKRRNPLIHGHPLPFHADRRGHGESRH